MSQPPIGRRPVSTRSSSDVIARATAQFDDGNHRGAWDSLLVWARREPREIAYREALRDLYRRAGMPDQAGRWGAHDPDELDARERRSLEKSLRGFETERAVRRYLVLPDEVDDDLLGHLGSRRHQRLLRLEPLAEELVFTAGIVAGLLGGIAIVAGVVRTLAETFVGGPDTQSLAQVTVCAVLADVLVGGALLAVANGLRERWISAAFFAAAGVAAAVGIAHADLTTPLPFGCWSAC